jgi:peptidoglycan/LPS O-acetylase OafA/YrhL
MSTRNVFRFVLAIIAGVLVLSLVGNRLPEPLVQSLGFWVMLLLLPLTFSDRETDKKPSLARHILAATGGAVVVLVLNILL